MSYQTVPKMPEVFLFIGSQNSRPRHVRNFLPALCEQFIEVAQYLLEGWMTIFGNLENSTYSVFIFYFLGIHTGKTLFWFIFCFRFRFQYSKKCVNENGI